MANLKKLREVLTETRAELAQIQTDSFDAESFEKQSQLERTIERLEALEQVEIKREALDSQISTAESNLAHRQKCVDEKSQLKPKFDATKSELESSVKAMFGALERVREIDPNFKLPTGYLAQFATSEDCQSNFKSNEWSQGGAVPLPREIKYTDLDRKCLDEAQQTLESLKTERSELR